MHFSDPPGKRSFSVYACVAQSMFQNWNSQPGGLFAIRVGLPLKRELYRELPGLLVVFRKARLVCSRAQCSL